MNYAKKELETLSFERTIKSGSVQETFYPWDLTLKRFVQDGMSKELAENALFGRPALDTSISELQKLYFLVHGSSGVLDYEQSLSFDPLLRTGFSLPFTRSGNPQITCRISDTESWETIREYGRHQLDLLYGKEQLQELYSPIALGHEQGHYSLRMNIEGFFWVPRELLGIERHLFAFYDEPELIHEICAEMMDIYESRLLPLLDMLKPEVLYISEDLSGKNGPMISPAFFDEFMGQYYQRLIPKLKQHGVHNVFVDTDGDFQALIPHFMKVGVDGFLPMDVNAGMDIVAVRKEYPRLKFIGGYNKLSIAEGKDAIDREFERILPVILEGGYIPGSDHQIPPSASLGDYRYYIQKLHQIMEF